MALDTYSDLVTAVGDFLNNTTLTASVPTFIRLAEARFNRILRTPQMETRVTATATSEFTTLPTDFRGMRVAFIDGTPDRPLEAASPADIKAKFGSETGIPLVYAINAGQLQLAPAPTDATVIAMTYWQSIPALTSSNTTNWLMTANPDVYLLGCLVAAELRGWNDERLPLIKSALDEMLTEIDVEGTKKRWGASPIRARSSVGQVRGIAS